MTTPGDYLLIRADAGRLPLPDRSVDLVLGSPPYADARLYLEGGKDLGIARGCREWVEWMLGVTAEAQRVSRGPVIWIAAGVTRDRNYWPACEGLMWEWWKRGGECQLYRPCYWHRVGIPGSGHDDWFRHDVEYCMCFKRPGKLPWADNTAMGHPPKWAPGGEMSNRLADGTRVNQWGGHPASGRSRTADGEMQEPGRPSHRFSIGNTCRPNGAEDKGRAEDRPGYEPPALANPGNLIRSHAGRNHTGHALCHQNEAPFPERVAEWFIRSLCPPGGIALDPFSGSGTTASVAARHGRRAIGADLRQSQCLLGRRRIAEQLLDLERPHRPKARLKPGAGRPVQAGLFGGEDAP